MKIVEKIFKRKDDYCDELSDYRIEVCAENHNDEKVIISFNEGEPEDMVLYRDLSSAYNLFDLAILCYEAGLAREKLEIERLEINDDE